MDMRIILGCFLFCSYVLGIKYGITSSQDRSGGYKAQFDQRRIAPKVSPSNATLNPRYKQNHLGVMLNEQSRNYSSQGLKTKILPKDNPREQARIKPKINIIPASSPKIEKQKQNILSVDVYPPVAVIEDVKSRINLKIGQSTPITQDMMFQKMPPYKMRIPPRKQKAPPPPPPPFVPPPDEYEGEDNEPLFIRNRNGVMIGAGIGVSIDRLWVGGSGGNEKFFDPAFSYYFRLGYQHYFKKFLGARIYAHLGDWSNHFSRKFFDGNRLVGVESQMSFNYSFFAEILYDFIVLEKHSFGIFGGLGIGVSYGDFKNDDTQMLKEYFAMPALSFGFAYTYYENNRFELETKIPLRSEILEQTWRAELSTWMLGVSYTYIF